MPCPQINSSWNRPYLFIVVAVAYDLFTYVAARMESVRRILCLAIFVLVTPRKAMSMNQKNVLGDRLQPCSTNPMTGMKLRAKFFHSFDPRSYYVTILQATRSESKN